MPANGSLCDEALPLDWDAIVYLAAKYNPLRMRRRGKCFEMGDVLTVRSEKFRLGKRKHSHQAMTLVSGRR